MILLKIVIHSLYKIFKTRVKLTSSVFIIVELNSEKELWALSDISSDVEILLGSAGLVMALSLSLSPLLVSSALFRPRTSTGMGKGLEATRLWALRVLNCKKKTEHIIELWMPNLPTNSCMLQICILYKIHCYLPLHLYTFVNASCVVLIIFH